MFTGERAFRQILLFAAIGLVASGLVMARVAWRGVRGPLENPLLDGADVDRLRARGLRLPVEGMKASELRDSFGEARGEREHEALDIIAPRGSRVVAVDDGRVVKLFRSARGGLTVYQFDSTETFCYYYAHLDGYAPGLDEGDLLRKGSLVGYVGTTGNAPRDTPHLHFTVFKLGPGKRWSEGRPINPFPLLRLAG